MLEAGLRRRVVPALRRHEGQVRAGLHPPGECPDAADCRNKSRIRANGVTSPDDADAFDEWLWRPALYYRWAFADDARLMSARLAGGMLLFSFLILLLLRGSGQLQTAGSGR